MGITHSTIDRSSAYNQLKADVAELKGSYVKVGYPAGAKPGEAKKTGSHAPYSDMSEIARIVAWNEFGVPNGKGGWHIPPRPAFRNAVDTCRPALADFQEKIINLVQLGKMKPMQAFEAVGLWMKARMQKAIRDLTDPPNAQRTIDAKGSSHPLIDTGQTINSITHVTVRGHATVHAGVELGVAV